MMNYYFAHMSKECRDKRILSLYLIFYHEENFLCTLTPNLSMRF